MSDSHFSIDIKHKFRAELVAKEGRRAAALLKNKINAEHGGALKKYFSTKQPCEKLWSKLPKEIQSITEVQESWPETMLNSFF